MIVVNDESLFEVQKQKEEAKGKITIILTPDLSIPTQDLMIRHRVKFDKVINFNDLSENINDSGLKKGGVTRFYSINNQDKAVVFIQSEFTSARSDGNERRVVEAYRYIFLQHELAYISDFENNINFEKESKKANLFKSEVYASVSTIKHLTLKKQTYERMLYANELLKLEYIKDDYFLKVQREVMKKYPKKKLMQWSKQLS